MKTILHESGCSSYIDGSYPKQMWDDGEVVCKLQQRCGNSWCVTESHIALIHVGHSKPEEVDTLELLKSDINKAWELYEQQGVRAVSHKYRVKPHVIKKIFKTEGKSKSDVELIKSMADMIGRGYIEISQEMHTVNSMSRIAGIPKATVVRILERL